MHVYTCSVQPEDHIGIAQHGANILVVVREAAHDDVAELSLTRTDARTAAEVIRQLISGQHKGNGTTIAGRLHIYHGEEEGTLLIAVDIDNDTARSVLLTHEHATDAADALRTCARHAAVYTNRQETGAEQPSAQSAIARMTPRAVALALAFKALGEPMTDILDAATWVMGEGTA
ncbi:hypothetical protein NLX83_13205 [Allokutzneria sp. A3M-2-11 16]|uniref:hypothetical protein n=1 Tax=Allokutzneria sp. A3M-2-11 16 TaxID=2962043 RepID=UPI0020B860C1|nr:hypothetical protein [Allokutzneria sp. A3M-2-11 16]MCP3800217.1 hypothetical protein [Allokutzneria sp. A3M-2-11 16]